MLKPKFNLNKYILLFEYCSRILLFNMHVNVRTTLHDRKTTLSQTRSPEIKAKKPESFLRRADPEKIFQKYKEGNHTESVLMALMHPI